MKKIGNIITKNKVDEEELYNVVSDSSELISDVPTLVIGHELTKFLFPQYNIINWKIDNGTYWCFGPRERRGDYEEKVKSFKELTLKRLLKKIKYKFVNIYLLDKEQLNQYMKNLVSEDITMYIFNDMCYIYRHGGAVVEGIYLKDVEYLGCETKKFLNYIYSHKKFDLVTSKDLSPALKSLFQSNIYIIPYLFS